MLLHVQGRAGALPSKGISHPRPQDFVHQCRFPGAGDSGNYRKPVDRKTDIDIFQVVRAGTADFDPAFNIAQTPPRFANGMTKRRLETAPGLGIFRVLDLAQRSGRDHFAAVNSRARAKIDNVIRAPHRFLIVLDDDERVSLFAKRGQRIEQPQIIARMQADGRLVQNIKNTAQIRAELGR